MAQSRKNNNTKSSRSSSNNSARSLKNCSNAKNSSKSNSNALDNMKYEIAKEFGVNLGADSSARANGLVGGEITKRLVEQGRSSKKSSRNNK